MASNGDAEHNERQENISWTKYLQLKNLNRNEIFEENFDISFTNLEDNSSTKLAANDAETFGINVLKENDLLQTNLFMCPKCRKILKLPKAAAHLELHIQDIKSKNCKESVDASSSNSDVNTTSQNSYCSPNKLSSMFNFPRKISTQSKTIFPQNSSNEEFHIQDNNKKFKRSYDASSSNLDVNMTSQNSYSFPNNLLSAEYNPCPRKNLPETETISHNSSKKEFHIQDTKANKWEGSCDVSSSNLDVNITSQNSYCFPNNLSSVCSPCPRKNPLDSEIVFPQTKKESLSPNSSKKVKPTQFDRSIHCGVLIAENKPCLHKIFCKNHKAAVKKDVPRPVSYDKLKKQSSRLFLKLIIGNFVFQKKAKSSLPRSNVPSSKVQPQVNQIHNNFPNNLHETQAINNSALGVIDSPSTVLLESQINTQSRPR